MSGQAYMRIRQRVIIFATVVLAAGGLACDGAGSETGNAGGETGNAGIELDFEISSGAVTATPEGVEVEVSRVDAVVEELKVLRDGSEDTDDDHVVVNGPILVDFLGGTNVLAGTDLPPGTFKKVELRFDSENMTLDGGSDAAMVISATVGGTPVSILLSDIAKLTLRDVDGVELVSGATSVFGVDLVVGELLADLDVDALTAEADGSVVVSKDSNDEAHKDIRLALKDALKLIARPNR